MENKRVLRTGDIAKICSVATRTVQKWFDEGILKGYKLPDSKDRRVRAEDLKEFMDQYNIPTEDWLTDAHPKCHSRNK
jgi:excisionase family DNA binding protein